MTYRSEVRDEKVLVANRASLWLMDGTRWRLRFHQGTAVKDDEARERPR